MINLSFPSDGLLFRSRRRLRHVMPYSIKNNDPSKVSTVASNNIGAPPATGGPWIVCHDQQARPFWLSSTSGRWIYPGVTNIVQPPPPPPMMYIPQAPQQYVAWVPPQGAFPQAMGGAVQQPGKGEGGKKNQTLLVKPAWERFYDSRGKSFWVHSKTGRRVNDDPYW